MGTAINNQPTTITNYKYLLKTFVSNSEQQILLLKRSATDRSRANCWDLPGGNIDVADITTYSSHSGKGDHDDILNQVLSREIKEETNLDIAIVAPILAASAFNQDKNMFIIAIAYYSHVIEPTSDVQLSSEHSEFQWVSRADLKDFHFGDDGGFYSAAISALLQHPSFS